MPNGNTKKTVGKTLKDGNTVTQKISSKLNNELLIIYIGGASDKKAWHTQKANENILDTKKGIVNGLVIMDNQGKIKIENYFSAYLGYFEVFSEAGRESVIENNIKNKQVIKNMRPTSIPRNNFSNLKIIIIGHSLGAWNGTHFANYLIQKGYPVDYLITIDPVGVGAAVKEIADVIKGTPASPKLRKKWINIREIGGGVGDMVARLGGRWYPFYSNSADDPDISYISMYSHEYTWEAMYIKTISRDKKHINPTSTQDSNPIIQLQKIVYDHKYDKPINWKILENPAKKSAWDSIYNDIVDWLKPNN